MSQINCDACSDLKTYAPNFAENGVTDTECTSLAADTGLNPNLSPKHKDADDLHDVNDCLVGRQIQDLEKYDVCDWQDYMKGFIPNLYETIKSIICALGGIWTYIHNLLSRVGVLETKVGNLETRTGNLETRMTTAEGNISTNSSNITNVANRLNDLIQALGGSSNVIPVIKRYRVTVPVGAFGQVWRVASGAEQAMYNEPGATPNYYPVASITEWFAGSGNNEDVGEFRVIIPVSEMESITGVWTQTQVVPSGNPYDGVGKGYIQTVNVQGWVQQGTNLIVNFDTFELCPPSSLPNGTNGGPYPVTVDFLVVGTKTFAPI